MIEITEIIRRSKQGITNPFVCRGEDQEVYFVKGRSAGKAALVKELISGHLALKLGLPIAPFEIVNIPEELIGYSLMPDIHDLGRGLAFGSRRVQSSEITYTNISNVPAKLQTDILFYDRWIQNEDRKLTKRGGNPNLLWNAQESRLIVIDHNLAFDSEFTVGSFYQDHIFHEKKDIVLRDLLERDAYIERFSDALADWDEIEDTVPLDWLFLDEAHSTPIDFLLNDARTMLDAAFDKDFWHD